MSESAALIPQPRPEDDEDVVWGLSTATALWARGERIDAIVWLRRAAEAAAAAGQGFRGSEIGLCASDLEERLNRTMSVSDEDTQVDDRLPLTAALAPTMPVMGPMPSESAAPADETNAEDEGDRISTIELEPEEVVPPPRPPPPPMVAKASAPSQPIPKAPLAPRISPPKLASVPAPAPSKTPPSAPVPSAPNASAPPPTQSQSPAPVTAAPPATPAPAPPASLPVASSTPTPTAPPTTAPPTPATPATPARRAHTPRTPILDPWAEELTPPSGSGRVPIEVSANHDEVIVNMRPARDEEEEDGVFTSAAPLETTLRRNRKPPPPPQSRKATLQPGQTAASLISKNPPAKPPAPPSSQVPVTPPPASVPGLAPSVLQAAPTSTSSAATPASPQTTAQTITAPPIAAPISAPLPPASAAKPASVPPQAPFRPLELSVDDLDVSPHPLENTLPSAPSPVARRSSKPPPLVTGADASEAIPAPAVEPTKPSVPSPIARPPSVAPPRPDSAKQSQPPRARSTPPPAQHVAAPSKRPSGAPSVRSAALGNVTLADVPELADLPDDVLQMLERVARIEHLSADEEVAQFGAALIIAGSASVCATIVDAPACRVATGTLIPSKGSLDDVIPLRVVAGASGASVAVWDEPTINGALRACPWVMEELVGRADRMQALAGATMGPLGDLDEATRNLLLDKLTVRVAAPSEVLTEEGKAPASVLLVGTGSVDLGAGNVARSGDILFPRHLIEGKPAPSSSKSGSTGALLLVGPKHVAQELFVTVPPLSEFLSG
jgi:hypothetical protein